MNLEQPGAQQPLFQDRSDMNRPPASKATRQHARNKGLAWVSAITLGAGAASTLGAVAIVTTMHGTTTATSASAVTKSGTSTGSSASQLQSTTAPTTSANPPVATSGAS
jgi:hypothetical protein